MDIAIAWVFIVIDNTVLLFLLLIVLGIFNSFFPPVPLESIIVLSGYLTGTGHGNLSIIWIASSIGMFIGNMLLYLLVHSQGEHLLRWRFIKAQLTPKHFDKAKIWFQRYGVWAIFGAKMIPGMNFAVVFCCGLLRLSYRKVYPALFLSNLILFGVLAGTGRYVSQEWPMVLSRGGKMTIWVGVILIVMVLAAWMVYRRIRKKS
jgi:membrane protein DedA with SNARE-associated domain